MGAVRCRAEEYRQALAAGTADLPFKQVVSCNIGNPQSLGQKPITFFRQVLALMDYPEVSRAWRGGGAGRVLGLQQQGSARCSLAAPPLQPSAGAA